MRRQLLLFLPLVLGLSLAWWFAYAQPTGTNTQPASVIPAYTFATLPTAKTGTIAYVSDGLAANCADTTCTTFGTAVTGGTGALKLLCWYNGANWTLIGK